MKFIALLITAILALPLKGCSNIVSSDSTVYLVIDFLPKSGGTGTVFIDMASRMAVIKETNLETLKERPPAPPEEGIEDQQSRESNVQLETEVLKLSAIQVDEIMQVLKSFEKEDYENQLNYDVLDGAAISIMHVNTENQVFKTELVNHMTINQRKLIEVVLAALEAQGSKNKEYLNYFRISK
jgi:hypothetical protein